jgi:hypothetical protein
LPMANPDFVSKECILALSLASPKTLLLKLSLLTPIAHTSTALLGSQSFHSFWPLPSNSSSIDLVLCHFSIAPICYCSTIELSFACSHSLCTT